MDRNPKVFCSHRSVDKPRVKEIAARLADAGIDPWVDHWEIEPGDDFIAKINEGLAACDVGLLFLSKATLDSKWVTAEASAMTHQRIEDGRRVLVVMIDADAPVPPLLKPLVRFGHEQIDELIAAIYAEPSAKPAVGPPRTRTRQRNLRIVLRSSKPGEIAVLAELDGHAVAPEQETRLGSDFVFSYQDFLKARLPVAHRSPMETATKMREEELVRLGDAVGRVVFSEPIASAVANLLDEARSANETILLAFETADPKLLSIPFESARLPPARGDAPTCALPRPSASNGISGRPYAPRSCGLPLDMGALVHIASRLSKSAQTGRGLKTHEEVSAVPLTCRRERRWARTSMSYLIRKDGESGAKATSG